MNEIEIYTNIIARKSICYSVTNKCVLLIFLSFLFLNIYSGLSFIQVGAKKQYHIHILYISYIYNVYCFLKILSIVLHLFVYMLLMK